MRGEEADPEAAAAPGVRFASSSRNSFHSTAGSAAGGEANGQYRRLSGGEPSEASAPLRSSSSRLLRAASTTFTGGAAVLPPAAEAPEHDIRRRNSMRQMRTTTVQQRMMEEIWARYQFRIRLLIFLLVNFSIVMMLLFYNALYAEMFYFGMPCDQPLKYYFAASFIVGQTAPTVVKVLLRQPWAQENRTVVFIVSLAGSVPGWTIIIWGLTMILSCKSCQDTNPNLYYPTKHFIMGQVVLFVLTTLFFSVGFTGVLSSLSTMADNIRPGCAEAVQKLPKVASDDPELIDPEDGNVLDCPICAESLAVQSKAVVRTNCHHHFHEACLLRWCNNHMDCPMCRATVGEPDPLRRDAPEEV